MIALLRKIILAMLLQLELICVKFASSGQERTEQTWSLFIAVETVSLPDEKLKIQSQKLPPSLFAEAVAQRKHLSSVWSQQWTVNTPDAVPEASGNNFKKKMDKINEESS